MERYVIGIDLGTSAVKTVLVTRAGKVAGEVTEAYPLYQDDPGYSEQEPEDWVQGTVASLRKLVEQAGIQADSVVGISFSGQMHGLVLVDGKGQVLRRAILWNDTRTTEQCRRIENVLGAKLLDITRNRALEGFTLPKLLWVQEREPELLAQAAHFMLPKDYVRYRLTGELASEYSDAAGTLLLDVAGKCWSKTIAGAFHLPLSLCPPLVESFDQTGGLVPDIAAHTGLAEGTPVFAGGADNACGAIGSGVLSEGQTMCSIGTSGVVLAYEQRNDLDIAGRVHFFHHGEQDAYYMMGVTLAAGYSLTWFKQSFAPEQSFEELLRQAEGVLPGSGGLLFTPYIVGERTPHPDAHIRGSFIGIDASHKLPHFTRAVLEGITFSLRESIDILRSTGKEINEVISIGGGARSALWLQMQADIFNAPVIKLESEQGPALGAAMLAAYGCGWFDSLQSCARMFIRQAKRYIPHKEAVCQYERLFGVYREVYEATCALNHQLCEFR